MDHWDDNADKEKALEEKLNKMFSIDSSPQ
jgi:hypothetical protein